MVAAAAASSVLIEIWDALSPTRRIASSVGIVVAVGFAIWAVVDERRKGESKFKEMEKRISDLETAVSVSNALRCELARHVLTVLTAVGITLRPGNTVACDFGIKAGPPRSAVDVATANALRAIITEVDAQLGGDAAAELKGPDVDAASGSLTNEIP